MNDFGLDEKTISILKRYFEKISFVDFVKIYGSRAIGNYRSGSDIDFAIFGKDLNQESINEIKYQIDELPIPYMFDITDYNSITNEKLKEHIDEFGKIFYSRQY